MIFKNLKNGNELYLSTTPADGLLVLVTDGKGRYDSAFFMDYKWWKECDDEQKELEYRPIKWYRSDSYINYKQLAKSISRKEKIKKILAREN